MRAFLLLGRPCPRTMPTRLFTTQPLARIYHRPQHAQIQRHRLRKSRPIRATLRAATGAGLALGTASFVELSKSDTAGTSETAETRMLEVSRWDLSQRRRVADDDSGLSRIRHGIVYLWMTYVWEPVATCVRFVQLVVVFVPVIVALPAIWVGKRQPERDGERSGTLWWYGFLVKSMEWAGPAFIKLGQWAASRSDIFPNELCATMSKLHSHAPAHSMQETRRIVEEAFDGRPFDEIFDEFDETPLGVGAIAQVYKAKLKPGVAAPGDLDGYDGQAGRRGLLGWRAARTVRKKVDTVLKKSPHRVPSSYVAVKVLHPGVERKVARDLRIMAFFASLLNAIPTMVWLSLPDEVAVFGGMMRLQLDLRIEAANLTMFQHNFRERTMASFPVPYTEFTTRDVLVEEFAQGVPLADFLELGGGVFQKDIAGEGLDAFLRMLLLDNFVHADLHPGNIMVRFYQAAQPPLPDLTRTLPKGIVRRKGEASDGSMTAHQSHNGALSPRPDQQQADVTEQVLSRLRPFRESSDAQGWLSELAKLDAEGFRPQLVFIDTGLVTCLNETNRRNFLDLFRAVAEFDGFRAGQLMCERSRQPDAVVDADVFALKMQHLVLGVKSRTLALGKVKIGDVLQQVLSMVRQHHVRIEGDFVNVVVAILLLEGIGRSLDPDLDLLSAAVPILRQLSAQSAPKLVKQGDFSVLYVWMGLETRRFLQASIEDVERCVKYDLLSPNI